MKIIQAVHINGSDKHKRCVKIVAVVTSKDGFLYWKNGDTWHKFEVQQEVLAFFDRKTKEVKYPPEAQ